MQEFYMQLPGVYARKKICVEGGSRKPELFRLLNADGIAFVNNRQVFSVGKTPDEIDIVETNLWLKPNVTSRIHYIASSVIVTKKRN